MGDFFTPPPSGGWTSYLYASQGFSFLHKNVCNVRDVEFARAYRITNNTIEPVSFSVPRVKTAFFQDDIFPPTRVLWEATVSADEWFGGSEKTAPRVSLRPDDMQGTNSKAELITIMIATRFFDSIVININSMTVTWLHNQNFQLPHDFGVDQVDYLNRLITIERTFDLFLFQTSRPLPTSRPRHRSPSSQRLHRRRRLERRCRRWRLRRRRRHPLWLSTTRRRPSRTWRST